MKVQCPSCKKDWLKHIPLEYAYSCLNCGNYVSAEFVNSILSPQGDNPYDLSKRYIVRKNKLKEGLEALEENYKEIVWINETRN